MTSFANVSVNMPQILTGVFELLGDEMSMVFCYYETTGKNMTITTPVYCLYVGIARVRIN